jgi:hypothetical protein
MDRFVPKDEHLIEMTRHLRTVPESSEEASYVVARSEHVRPGTPFVIAKCIDPGVAVVFALAGQQAYTREEMSRVPPLAEALAAWESGDDSLFRMERRARAAFGRSDRKEELREIRWHPSRTGNAQR